MNKKNDYIYEATVHLEQMTNLNVEFESNRSEYDAKLSIKNQQFIVYAKTEARGSNKGIILSQLHVLRQNYRFPIIMIAKFLATEVAKEFRELGVNYIDAAGNAYINEKEIFIFILGRKINRPEKTNQSRAFQEVGIKLIFNLLRTPENLQLSYRELSELTEISIGSVSNVMNELEDLNYILRTNNNRILRNTQQLLNRWIVAYNDVLRPRILKKRFKFSNRENLRNWKQLQLQENEETTLWGGEPAAAILTKQLQPEKISIYTKSNWQNIARNLKLIPTDDWDIEILQMFWKPEIENISDQIAPPLLVYADLISTGIDRNLQIAKIILDNELQYIK
ncbi:MAG: type IV toxin-antitoxin system AbiEi family antitoxin [Bacteroidales bacterium]